MNNLLLKRMLTSLLFVTLAVVIEFYMFASFGWGIFPKYALFDLGIIFFVAFLIFACPSSKSANAILCTIISFQILFTYTNIIMMGILNNVLSVKMLVLVGETAEVLTFNMFPWAPLVFFGVVIAIMVFSLIFLSRIPVDKKSESKITKYIIRFAVLFGLTISMLMYSVQTVFLHKEEGKKFLLGDDHLYRTFSSEMLSLKRFGTYCYYVEEFARLFVDVEQIYNISYEQALEYLETETYDPKDSALWNALQKNGKDNIVIVMGESYEWYPISKELTPVLYALANGYDFGENGEGLFDLYSFTTDENGCLQLQRKDYEYNEETKTYSQIDGVVTYDEEKESTYGMTLVDYYSKAKTDYSETSVILGNYPYNKSFVERTGFSSVGLYANVDYCFSLPNQLKESSYIGEDSAWYFHTFKSSFYGRNTLIPQYGFDRTYFYEYFTQNPNIETGPTLGSAIKDSQVMSEFGNLFVHCDENGNKLSDEPWLSFFTTVTTHGDYSYNFLLEKNYEFLESVDYAGKPSEKITDYDSLDGHVATYLASCIDTEQMFAYLLYYLNQTNQFDNTTIVFFGDHNAYYEQLDMQYKAFYYNDNYSDFSNFRSDYQKDNSIMGKYAENCSERYSVAAFIYSPALDKVILNEEDQNGEVHKLQYIQKFACAFDFAPTILTMCGIDYDPHFYLGYPILCPFEVNGEIIELGTDQIISHTGGFFNKQIYSEDGLRANYMVGDQDMNKFSYNCVKYLERWYRITALYDYNLFKKN